MAEVDAVAKDLQFVRKAVELRDRNRPPLPAPLIIWTFYSLICIPSYDYLPRYGGRINLVGWITAAILTGVFAARAGRKSGQFDRALLSRILLHWYGGIALMLLTIFGLVWTHQLKSYSLTGQFSLIFVGFLYFTAGVHLPDMRFMRWIGPIIVLTGIAIGLLPSYRWTFAGLVFALCLMAPVAKSFSSHPQPIQTE